MDSQNHTNQKDFHTTDDLIASANDHPRDTDMATPLELKDPPNSNPVIDRADKLLERVLEKSARVSRNGAKVKADLHACRICGNKFENELQRKMHVVVKHKGMGMGMRKSSGDDMMSLVNQETIDAEILSNSLSQTHLMASKAVGKIAEEDNNTTNEISLPLSTTAEEAEVTMPVDELEELLTTLEDKLDKLTG